MTESLPTTDTTSSPHLVRITDNGKIKAWVSFALSFLEANEDRPIVFHTLPAVPKPLAPATEDAAQPSVAANKPLAEFHISKMSKATTAVPRLLTVVEIVKREFMKSLEAKRSPRLAGLHQYNEIGCLEALTPPVEAALEDRPADIQKALSGRNHVRQKQTPYMKVTLSLTALPELVQNGATYQPPTLRKLSKSAKMRMKRRERVAKIATSVQTPVDPNTTAAMGG
ncbi:hypothetical protein H0H87_010658 [Tephrocybe sp. NHM501043]|nr:hypothetical protein H0H87_010658 [Tephrocybe sp. NHM501043]